MYDSIAITGGTGTLGQALVAEILANHQPTRLVIISRGEARQAEMKKIWPEAGPLRYFIGDVRDEGRMLYALEGCQTVIHAAALKRVEVCEREPEEALLTNVIGTRNVARAAREVGASRFMLVSSDKACAAATTYGATKYLAERYVVGMNNYAGHRSIRFSCVRYGNVLGSTGSVAHSFLDHNGKITITHPDMTRFWWTAKDAARFIMSSLAMMRGGEIFIPRLSSLRITDMASMLAPDAEMETIGLRGAEKLHESLVSPDESLWAVELPDRYAILPSMPQWSGWEWPEAKPMQMGWSYSSENADRLTEGYFMVLAREAGLVK